MLERTSKLRRKIFAWIDLQTKFLPGLKNVRELEDEARARAAESSAVPGVSVSDVKLWFPSDIAAAPRELVLDVSVKAEVQRHEYRLRVGQAEEALHEVRRLLLVRTHVYQLKDEHARGVHANTRSQDKISALNDQTQRSAEQYRAARAALVILGRVLNRHEWERTLLELKGDDVRGLPQSNFHDPERKKKKKQRRKGKKVQRPPSWIWVTPGAQYNPGDGAAMNEGMYALFCSGRDCADHQFAQRSASNGRRCARGVCAGGRRWICWRRRWGESCGFSFGGRRSGRRRWAGGT